MNALRTVLGWMAAGALLAASAAQAAVVYNNGAPNGVSGNDATQWVQTEDFGFGTATTISGAGVYIAGFNGIGNWDGTIDYFIFTDSAGQPGALQATGAGQGVTVTDTGTPWGFGGNAFLVEFDFMSDFLAGAGSTYWFGIHLSNNFDRDDIYWVTTAGNGTSTGLESDGGTFNNWSNNGQEHAYFLNGSRNVVPEPSGLALAGAAMLALAAVRRRRH